MSERRRLSGALQARVVEAGLRAFMREMWTGGAGQIGINEPRNHWRWRMEAGLEAAFDELLKDPSHDPH